MAAHAKENKHILDLFSQPAEWIQDPTVLSTSTAVPSSETTITPHPGHRKHPTSLPALALAPDLITTVARSDPFKMRVGTGHTTHAGGPQFDPQNQVKKYINQ